MSLNYDYTVSKIFCQQTGLTWLGDDFVRAADMDAKLYNFTQDQVDIAMKNHLWQVKFLFDPKSYGFLGRIKLALHFLFNLKIKK